MLRRLKILFLLFFILSLPARPAFSFWMWTPETNEWVNPKYAVKETPSEQLQYSIGFYQKKDYDLAIKEFRKLISHYPKAREAPEAQFYVGQCYESLGNLYQAFKEYQIVVDKYPFSERSGDIVQKQYDIGVRLLNGKQNRNKFVDAFIGADYNVIDIFKTVIKNAPYGPLAPKAQYEIGLYLAEKQLYQEARDEFDKVINDYPESEWAKAAKYQIALTDSKRSTDAAYDQKVTQVAVQEFKEFVGVYPDAELSDAAKKQIDGLKEKEAENVFLIAKFYEKQKNYKSAKLYYQSIVDDYSQTKWVAPSLKKIREIAPKIK